MDIFSGGICYFVLALLYWLVDVAHYRRWSFFFTVIGVNSIAAYVISDGGVRDYISTNQHTHLGQHYDGLFGQPFAELVNGILVLTFIWLLLHWMYSRKIFIKI